MKETYDLMLKDLNEACQLLPFTVDPEKRNRPSQAAAYALLSRIYLVMGSYDNAKKNADSCLHRYSILIDFNSISVNLPRPLSNTLQEVIYQAHFLSGTEIFKSKNCIVDSSLFNFYKNEDLRRLLFFKYSSAGVPVPNSYYTGSIYFFAGIGTDEIYLIRAECEARMGEIEAAIRDLVVLQKHRLKSGFSYPLGRTAADVLKGVLEERRRSLIFRGLRWSDIRRLNREHDTISLTRVYNSKIYTLEPKSPRLTLPIPPNVIRLSGIEQNPR